VRLVGYLIRKHSVVFNELQDKQTQQYI